MFKVYKDRRVLVVGLLGFASGVPLLLTSSTLSLWLDTGYGLSRTQIGFFALAMLPYAFKFVWSPLIDRLNIPVFGRIFGRRRGWLLFSQISLMLSLVVLANLNLAANIPLTAALVFCVSFFSATQDILLLTYQAERLGRNTYGAGEAMTVFGYRMGMVIGSAGALYIAGMYSWSLAYMVMASLVFIGVITTLSMEEPQVQKSKESQLREEKARQYLNSHPKLKGWKAEVLAWFYGAVFCPFSDFMRQKIWLPALFLMFFYKLGDNLIGTMSNLFYVDLGFSKIDIANASKIFGMWAAIFGGFIAGVLINRIGMIRSLFWFAAVHGVATLMYIVMLKSGKSMSMLYLSIAIEQVTAGMRTTALFSYQLTITNLSYAATQLALMTSLVHFGRTSCSSISGYMVDQLGWEDIIAE